MGRSNSRWAKWQKLTEMPAVPLAEWLCLLGGWAAGPALWHNNYSPALQMSPRRSTERPGRLITMTMGTLRAGQRLDTASEMAWMTFSSRKGNGRLWFPKTRTDGRGHRIFVWIIRQPFLALSSQSGGALNGPLTELGVDRPYALPHSLGATAFVSLFDCVLFMKWRG